MNAFGTYPRLLLINGEPINGVTSTGFNLANTLGNWPAESLFQIFTSPLPITPSLCTRNIHLKPWSMPGIVALGAGWERIKEMSHLRTQRVAVLSSDRSRVTIPGHGSTVLRRKIRSLLDLYSYALPKSVIREIQDYGPQVVYSLLGSSRIMSLALSVTTKFRAPLVINFMDDWPSSLHSGSLLRPMLARRMERLLKQTLLLSTHRIVISPFMAEEYRRRYGGEFSVLLPSVEPVIYDHYEEVPPALGAVRFTFLGQLGYGRAEVLAAICDVVGELHSSGISIELHLHLRERDQAEYGPSLRKSPAVRIKPPVHNGKNLLTQLHQTHCLLHIDGFGEDSVRHFALSLSGKIPLFLAAGRPILACGPPQIGTMRYLEQTGACVSVGELDPVQIRKAILTLLADARLRTRLGANGRKWAIMYHSPEKVQSSLRDHLVAASIPIT